MQPLQTYAVCVKNKILKHVIDVTDEYLSAAGSSYGLGPDEAESAVKALVAERLGEDLDIAIVHADDESEAIQAARVELEIEEEEDEDF